MSYSSRSQKCKMSLSELIHGVSRVGLLSEAPGNSISLPFPAPKVALFLPLGPLPRKQQQGISLDSFSIITDPSDHSHEGFSAFKEPCD